MGKRLLPTLIVLVVLVLGAWLRFSELGRAPLQSDESINWYLSQGGATRDAITYDPTRFHGPLYLKLLSFFGSDSEFGLRALSALSGLALAALPLTLIPFIGVQSAVVGVTLLSLDPLAVFYSRMAIHETFFVLLTGCFLLTLYTWVRLNKMWCLTLSGVLLGLMAATKETFVLPLLAGTLGILCIHPQIPFRRLVIGIAVAALAAYLTLAAALSSLHAPILVTQGVVSWARIGVSDSNQVQPWWYFLGLLCIASPLALLCGAILPAAWKGPGRYFLVVGAVTLLGYSLLPYKTPWLALGMLFPLHLSFALSLPRIHWLIVILPVQLILNYLPYTTAHLRANDTYPATIGLADRILDRCATAAPQCQVLVSGKWIWPLPFYLRSLEKQVIYSERIPPHPIDSFLVMILPENAVREIPGWSRELVTLSRVQRVNVYFSSRPRRRHGVVAE